MGLAGGTLDTPVAGTPPATTALPVSATSPPGGDSGTSVYLNSLTRIWKVQDSPSSPLDTSIFGIMGVVGVGGGDWDEVAGVVFLEVPKVNLVPVPTPNKPFPSVVVLAASPPNLNPTVLTAPNPPPPPDVPPNILPFAEDDPNSGVVVAVSVVDDLLDPKNPA